MDFLWVVHSHLLCHVLRRTACIIQLAKARLTLQEAQMLGLLSRKDVERLLAASGASLNDVLQTAGQNSQVVADDAARIIDVNKALIAKSQLIIADETRAQAEARSLLRLVKQLGG
jgi:hypothetical protein